MSSSLGMLKGCLICVTGGSSGQEKAAECLTIKHGGKFSRSFDSKKVTHLIVHKVGSKKHEMAIKQKVWAVRHEWLVDSENCGKRLDEQDYRVGPFRGLNISVTQLSPDERVQIEKVVTSGGGMFSSDLRKENCTHLVAQSPTGEKYSAARTWGGIWLVTRQWVDDCADMGVWCSERSYPVLDNIALKNTNDELIKTEEGTGKNAEELHASVSHPSEEIKTEKLLGSADEQDYALLTLAIPLVPSGGRYMSYFAAQYALSDSNYSDNTTQEYFNSNALQDHVFFVSGFSAQVNNLIRQLIILGGGYRHEMLTNQVTTVLLGLKTSDRLKRSVLSHPMKPLPLTLSWLLRSVIYLWSPPTVADINSRIELNRAVEKSQVDEGNTRRSNCFENYKVLVSDVTENCTADGDTIAEGYGNDDETLFVRNICRPVVMTWKEKEIQNNRITAELVDRKRKSDLKRGAINDLEHVENDSNEIQRSRNGNGNKDMLSNRKALRKEVIFRKSTSPDIPSVLHRKNVVAMRKSRRLSMSGEDCFRMPPGESQVAVIESLESDSGGDDENW